MASFASGEIVFVQLTPSIGVVRATVHNIDQMGVAHLILEEPLPDGAGEIDVDIERLRKIPEADRCRYPHLPYAWQHESGTIRKKIMVAGFSFIILILGVVVYLSCILAAGCFILFDLIQTGWNKMWHR